jgi:hypothetical protein
MVRRLALACFAAVLASCGRDEPSGPVRSPMRASEIAQMELRAAGLDEQVIGAERRGPAWVVTTRRPDRPTSGHLVTVDAQTGAVRVERYRLVELGRRPR